VAGEIAAEPVPQTPSHPSPSEATPPETTPPETPPAQEIPSEPPANEGDELNDPTPITPSAGCDRGDAEPPRGMASLMIRGLPAN
jgi:hypothetical protein